MTRATRVVLPEIPHHITQHGIRRFDVFRDEADRATYLKLLAESCRRFQLPICSYCLMTNHVHVVAMPERRDSLWRTFHRCHGVYANRFNRKYGLTGHLWQARPFSCALDEEHPWQAIRYVELNPVRAHMVERAEDYPWSSAAAHCGLREDLLIVPEWATRDEIQNWKQWLAAGNESDVDQRIRHHTFIGRPCGNDTFVQDAEQLLGRRLAPRKPGPKPKSVSSEDDRSI